MSDFGIPISLLTDTAGAEAASTAGQVPVPPPTAANIAAGAPPADPKTSVLPTLAIAQTPEQAYVQTSQFDVAGFDAKVASAKKNVPLLEQAQQAQMANYDAVIAADEKLKNIQRFGGQKSPIVKIMGLFDSDWSAPSIALDLDEQNTKTQKIVDQTKTQMAINEVLPGLIEDMGKSADKMFTNVGKVKDYELNVAKFGLEQQAAVRDAQRLRLESIRTSIDMSQEQRAQSQAAVDRMGIEDKQRLITQLEKNPKDPRRNQLGMLRESVVKEQTAEASLASATTQAAKGMREESQASMQQFSDNLPISQLAPRVQAALKAGSPTIDLGKGVKLPLVMAMKSMQTAKATEDGAQAQLAQQEAEDSQIGERTKRLANSAAAVASVSPEAAGVLQVIRHSAQDLNNNPTYQQVLAHKAQLANMEGKLKGIMANFAKEFPSKNAQAAVENFGINGKFDRQGAAAVLGDTVGNIADTNSSKYAPAFKAIGQEIARQLKTSQVGGGSIGAFSSGPMDMTDMQALLAGAHASPKLAAIKQNVLSDPATMQAAANIVKASTQKDALVSAINGLAHSKNASPVWQNMLDHPDEILSQGADGKISLDTNKLATRLEQAKVLTRGKVDYPSALSAALRSYGATADNSDAHDPRMTIHDRALKSYLFGERSDSTIVGDLVNKFVSASKKAHNEMQSRIQDDVAGRTQAEAAQAAVNASANTPEASLLDPSGQSFDLKNFDRNKVPSRTGTGLTAQQIKSLYGGD